jgi:hypothetical protein
MSSYDKHLDFNFQDSEITAGALPRKLPGTSMRNGTGVSGAGNNAVAKKRRRERHIHPDPSPLIQDSYRRCWCHHRRRRRRHRLEL